MFLDSDSRVHPLVLLRDLEIREHNMAALFMCALLLMTSAAIPMTSSQQITGKMEDYRIPLPFPPDFPKLLDGVYLTYKGDRGNGVAGYRWDIEGLPKISRCGVSPAQSRKYCLDGRPLVVTRGTYGSDKSEYKLDSSYKQIIAHGSKASHPEYFEAITRDDKQLIFGETKDSQLIGQNQSAVHTWFVSRVVDGGNTTRLTYDGQSSYRYLERILHNSLSIDFAYVDRKDTMARYFEGGVLYKMDKVLKSITSFVDRSGRKHVEWRLGHTASGSASLSLLTDLTVCDVRNICTKRFGLAYMDTEDRTGSDGLEKPTMWIGGAAYGYNQGWRTSKHPRFIVDMNGDGKKDVVGFAEHGATTSLNTYSAKLHFGFEIYHSLISAFGYVFGGWRLDNLRLVVDWNGDGLPDVIGFGGNELQVALNILPRYQFIEKVRFLTTDFAVTNGFNARKRPMFVKDVNKDGLPDIFCYSKSSVLLGINLGMNTRKAKAVSTDMTENQGWTMDKHIRLLEDVNGDGLPDMVGFGNDGVSVALNIDGETFESARDWSPQFGYNAKAGGWRLKTNPRFLKDVNGDGLPDIVGFSNDAVVVALNTGTGFTKHTSWYTGFGSSANWLPEHQRELADMNGDGLPDIVGFGCCNVQVALNTGSSFAKGTVWTAEYGWNNGWGSVDYPKLVDDLTGDGVAEVIGFNNDGVLVAVNRNSPISLVKVDRYDAKIEPAHCPVVPSTTEADTSPVVTPTNVTVTPDKTSEATPTTNTTVIQDSRKAGVAPVIFGTVVGLLAILVLAQAVALVVLAIKWRTMAASASTHDAADRGVPHVNRAFDSIGNDPGKDGTQYANLDSRRIDPPKGGSQYTDLSTGGASDSAIYANIDNESDYLN